jgi:hypothetical protein
MTAFAIPYPPTLDSHALVLPNEPVRPTGSSRILDELMARAAATAGRRPQQLLAVSNCARRLVRQLPLR